MCDLHPNWYGIELSINLKLSGILLSGINMGYERKFAIKNQSKKYKIINNGNERSI